MHWKTVAALLAAYGLLKEIRPSEPFITPFFLGPDKNFTSQQVMGHAAHRRDERSPCGRVEPPNDGGSCR